MERFSLADEFVNATLSSKSLLLFETVALRS
jgi:hypothetical protein